MKRIAALLTLAAAVCLSTSSTLRADITTENTNFIDMAYQDLLQRSPNPTEIANGLNALLSETRFQFALSIDTSNEYYQLLVESYSQGLLGRPASPTELVTFTGLLASNFTDEFIQAQIASTAEFFLDSGSTDAGFVTALFKDFLNRNPSSGEVAFWVSALVAMSRDQVASLILGSLDYDSALVKSYYLQFLQRPAGPVGLNAFATALNGGTLTNEQVIASLVGSDEYFKLAQTPGPVQTPEPRTVVLLGLGLATLILVLRQAVG
jgi:hypothetical protein